MTLIMSSKFKIIGLLFLFIIGMLNIWLLLGSRHLEHSNKCCFREDNSDITVLPSKI